MSKEDTEKQITDLLKWLNYDAKSKDATELRDYWNGLDAKTRASEYNKYKAQYGDKGGDDKKDGDKKDGAFRRSPAPATVVVRLPENATLTIDGIRTTSTPTVRTFITPPLATGRVFHYDFQATVSVDGTNMVLSLRVPVQAGQQTQVNMFPASTGVAMGN